MASTPKKIIAVVGATGNQGGSVARTFLGLPQWHVRCLTRNPLSKAAQELTSLGAEVVQADMASETSLSKAFADVHAIFLNTDFRETYRPRASAKANTAESEEQSPSTVALETEISHGKNVAIAASKIPTLEKLVYSALLPMKQLSHGKYVHSYHWESKAAIVNFIKEDLTHLAKKTSEIYLGAYTTNALIAPRFDQKSGRYTFITPLKRESRIPIIDPTTSTGPFVRVLIENEPAGIQLLAYDSYPTMAEIADIWCRASGQEASLHVMALEQIHQILKIPMEVLDGVGFIDEFGYTGGVKMVEPGDLNQKVETKSYEDWMMERDWKDVLEAGEKMVKAALK